VLLSVHTTYQRCGSGSGAFLTPGSLCKLHKSLFPPHKAPSFGKQNRELHNNCSVSSSNFRTGQIVYREVRKNTACIMRKKQKGGGEGGGGRGRGGGLPSNNKIPRNDGSLCQKPDTTTFFAAIGYLWTYDLYGPVHYVFYASRSIAKASGGKGLGPGNRVFLAT
jgi:hypothetical protein